jgi:hypothetical protein
MAPHDMTAGGWVGGRTPRNGYMDLDRAYAPRENYTAHEKLRDEAPKPRVRLQPEMFLTEDNSSFAMQALPKVVQPKTAAAEESILKKWEAWSTKMGTQLGLESTVASAPVFRASSRNGSFRSVSQLSNNSIPRTRPESARGHSPMSQSGRRSVSRRSSCSRQSSLASTVVEPFRVGDRMTASAERKRSRPQSTTKSRELLFRRALGLEDDKDSIQDLSITSASRRTAPAPGPLIAAPRAASSHRQSADSQPPVLILKETPIAMDTQPVPTVLPKESSAPQAEEHSTEAGASNTVLPKVPIAPETAFSQLNDGKEADDHDDEWLKKSIELLTSKDRSFTEVSAEKSTPPKEEVRSGLVEPTPTVSHVVEERWHLPVGVAAQVICGRVSTLRIVNCSFPSIIYRCKEHKCAVHEETNALPSDEAVPRWVDWPIDRASVEVLFVDHHEDDDQLSVYGVEVLFREDCSPEVLPDWNESRRRFAPAPIEDSQAPR